MDPCVCSMMERTHKVDKLPRGPNRNEMLSRRYRGQYVRVCLRTCACPLQKGMRSIWRTLTWERSRALQGAGEWTQAYLCFYEPLRIRLAWSNLPQPRPLSPQMRETGREEGVIEKPPVQNVWSMATCTTPLPVCIISELDGQSPHNFTSVHLSLSRKDTAVFKGLILPHLHPPAREGHSYGIGQPVLHNWTCIREATRAAVL